IQKCDQILQLKAIWYFRAGMPIFGTALMGFWPGRFFFVVLALAIALSAPNEARAQFVPPPPPPVPSASTTASDLSAGAGIANLGSNFLERLGDQATGGFGRASRSNPGGGGASEALNGQIFRSWGELYGISSTTPAQGPFFGDKRSTAGGIAGF